MRRGFSIAFSVALLAMAAARAEGDTEAEVRAVLEQLLEMSARRELLELTPQAASRFTESAAKQLKRAYLLGPPETLVDQILMVSPTHAAARTSGEHEGEHWEGYVYLERETEWRVVRLRSFRLTALEDERARLRASKRTPQIADRLRNLDLTLASDRTLASWFKTHHAELETLTQESTVEREARRCRQLGLTRVERSAGAVHVVVGGIRRDDVGFLFSPEAPPPPINPQNYLWVEPLGDGWFLYRTN